jgi:hypothetical protein
MFSYLSRTTGLHQLFLPVDDTRTGCRRPQAYLDDWLAHPDADPDQLHRIVDRVLLDPVRQVLGGDPATRWTGRWPEPDGTAYPTVYDYLHRIETSAPDPPPTPEESFDHLRDSILIPWNLELDDGDPALGPDWPDPPAEGAP